MISPYKGTFKVTQSYWNLRADGTHHAGFDLVGLSDKRLYSPVYGTIVRAGWENDNNHKQGWGQRVVIRIGESSFYMYFGHMSKITVKAGQKIEPGMYLGLEGSTGKSTGSHLHWEIRKNDTKKEVQNVSTYSGIKSEASKDPQQSEWGVNLFGPKTLKFGENEFPDCIFNAMLQSRLADFGYKIVADGIFGLATDFVVNAYQKTMGLEIDGLVGKLTKNAMRL